MTVFRKVALYANDALDLPVRSVDDSTSHYVEKLGFRIVDRVEAPTRRAILERDAVRIGLAENGRDPEQEGAYFEVSGLEAVFEGINGRSATDNDIKHQRSGGISQRVFFHIAPDGLCFLFGERV